MIDYKYRNMEIARRFCRELRTSNVAVSGSTNYGDGKKTPREDSDIDLIVLDSIEVRNAIKSVYSGPDNFRHLDTGYFDLVCIVTNIDNTRVSFNILKGDKYLSLCCEDNNGYIAFRDLRNKGIGARASAPYYVSGFNQNFWLQYTIEEFEEGHSIVCPTLNAEIFTINSIQEEILTQNEISDHNNTLFRGRDYLTRRVIKKAKELKIDPITLHTVKKQLWSEAFIEMMVRRYES